jgi:hypothetical protein
MGLPKSVSPELGFRFSPELLAEPSEFPRSSRGFSPQVRRASLGVPSEFSWGCAGLAPGRAMSRIDADEPSYGPDDAKTLFGQRGDQLPQAPRGA